MTLMTAATVGAPRGVFWRPSAALRVAHQPALARRLATAVLAVICAFALLLAAAPTASTFSVSFSETRVATQTNPAVTGVGFEQPVSPAVVGRNGVFGYDGSLGCCVAPRLLPNQVADAVDFGNLRFTDTAANHAATRPYVDSPLTLEEIVRAADPVPDPGGLPNGWKWEVPGSTARSSSYTDTSRNTSFGTWEVVIDLDTNTVVHFLFDSGS